MMRDYAEPGIEFDDGDWPDEGIIWPVGADGDHSGGNVDGKDVSQEPAPEWKEFSDDLIDELERMYPEAAIFDYRQDMRRREQYVGYRRLITALRLSQRKAKGDTWRPTIGTR